MNKLKQLRQKAGLSQAHMAKIAGVHPLSYQRYENDKRHPDILTAIKMLNELRVVDPRTVWDCNP